VVINGVSTGNYFWSLGNNLGSGRHFILLRGLVRVQRQALFKKKGACPKTHGNLEANKITGTGRGSC